MGLTLLGLGVRRVSRVTESSWQVKSNCYTGGAAWMGAGGMALVLREAKREALGPSRSPPSRSRLRCPQYSGQKPFHLVWIRRRQSLLRRGATWLLLDLARSFGTRAGWGSKPIERTDCDDSRCLPAVLRLQVHRLRSCLPGGVLLPRREDALHRSCRLHRLRSVRSRMSGGGHFCRGQRSRPVDQLHSAQCRTFRRPEREWHRPYYGEARSPGRPRVPEERLTSSPPCRARKGILCERSRGVGAVEYASHRRSPHPARHA